MTRWSLSIAMTLYCSSKIDISVFAIRILDAEFRTRNSQFSCEVNLRCNSRPADAEAGAQPASERASFTDAVAARLSSGVGAES